MYRYVFNVRQKQLVALLKNASFFSLSKNSLSYGNGSCVIKKSYFALQGYIKLIRKILRGCKNTHHPILMPVEHDRDEI